MPEPRGARCAGEPGQIALALRSLARLSLALLSLSGSSACYVKVLLPLDRDLDRTSLGGKVGRASAQSVLWGFAWGDAGIHAAARNGELSTIHHADQEYFVVLGGVYARLTTIAYGD